MQTTDCPTQQRDKTILIADDDREMVEMLALRCRGLGLNVLTANDALTALIMTKEQRPDFVCLDVAMPGGNGLSACEMLVTDEDWPSKPIMILTGKTDPDTIRRCHQLIAYYIEKCPNVWSRVEPLLKELMDEADDAPAAGRPVKGW